VTWRLRAERAVARLTGRVPSRTDQDRVLAYRRALQPAATDEKWTVSVEGCGFAATGPAGRRAVGLARGAAAAQELLFALSEPDAPPSLRWLTPRPPAPAGALTVYDEPRLGDIADFISASGAQRDQLRAALPEVLAGWNRTGISQQIHERAAELNRSSPMIDRLLWLLYPESRHRPREDLGRLRTFAWIEVDKVIAGGGEQWNGFGDHRPDTVPWIVQHVLGAADPGRAVLEAQADDVHKFAVLNRVPGPAGPVYLVGAHGRHRTHAMRILGVPWMVAEVGVTALPVLVEQGQLSEPQDPDYPALPIWRG
jgi:hypothetical protein